MFSLFIMTHGDLSESIYRSLCSLSYCSLDVHTFCIDEDTDVRNYEETARKEVEDILSKGKDVVILTDIQLGTPFNVAMRIMKDYSVYHITGINLPLLLHLNAYSRGLDNTEEVIKKAVEQSLIELYDAEAIKRKAEKNDCNS